jgi:hypothetical protein
MHNSRVAKIALKELWGAIRLVYSLMLLALLESWSRFLGWYDFAVKRERHVVWDMAYSQKQNVQELREGDGVDSALRPIARSPKPSSQHQVSS